MRVEVTDFNKRINNTLRGFMTVYLTDYGIEIPSFMVHERNGSRWVEIPGKPIKNGQGEQKWEKIFTITSKWKEKEFKDAILVALDKFIILQDIDLEGGIA
jgi:hypothetical protein